MDNSSPDGLAFDRSARHYKLDDRSGQTIGIVQQTDRATWTVWTPTAAGVRWIGVARTRSAAIDLIVTYWIRLAAA
jgi:hypothetical protein